MADMPIAAGAQGSVRYFNPDGLIDDPAFTEVVEVGGPARTIYIGMQHALTASRTMVGKGDLAAQTEQALKNVEPGLAAADAKPEHLVLLRFSVVEGQKLQQAHLRTTVTMATTHCATCHTSKNGWRNGIIPCPNCRSGCNKCNQKTVLIQGPSCKGTRSITT